MSESFSTMKKSIIEAGVIAVTVFLTSLGINLVHPSRIPYIADAPYETMVPCPVQEGHVTPANPTAFATTSKHVLFVDAREKGDYDKWHYPGALLLTYDFLDPIPESELRIMAQRIAALRATKVVVYGDGDDPDTGKLLGIDISASGINNVYFVRGGAAALEEAVASQNRGAQ
ncbi:MAG: rhodanese-like domain-containing protein [Deltaproteobacteria bacterium]|nr:rhodanese-like domain-containing protein [Deltaproteobacteria bacterium]